MECDGEVRAGNEVRESQNARIDRGQSESLMPSLERAQAVRTWSRLGPASKGQVGH